MPKFESFSSNEKSKSASFERKPVDIDRLAKQLDTMRAAAFRLTEEADASHGKKAAQILRIIEDLQQEFAEAIAEG